jgi:hypothetical protein
MERMSDPELPTVPPDFDGFDEHGRGWYFHLREGFYFRGRGDAVTLAVKFEGGYRTITVPPNEWASAVAAVSKRGDVQAAWLDALTVHEKMRDV